MTFTFEPLIPASLWLLLAVIAAVLLVAYGMRRPGSVERSRWVVIMSLMAGGIAAVLAVLLNPMWIDPIEPPAGKPLLSVLIDESASMAVQDAESSRSRFDAAREMARNMSRELTGKFDVQVRTFAEALSPTDLSVSVSLDGASPQPKGMLTDVGAAIAGSIDSNRSAGQAILLLSDGIDNAHPGTRTVLEAVRSVRAASVPIYAMTMGRSDTPDLFDLSADIHTPQQLSYVGQKLPINVRVRQRGGAAGPAEVTLYQEGEPIDKQTVMLSPQASPPQASAEAKFMVSRDLPGIYRYEARVELKPGEMIAANNNALQFVRVVNEPIRVLLIEGKPYWDNKFLMRTLAADPVIGLDSIVRMTMNRYLRRSMGVAVAANEAADMADMATTQAAGAAGARDERWKVIAQPGEVLSSAEALKPYQILVLGRDTEVFLSETAVNHIRQWISRQGGCLVCYRGSPAVQMTQRLAQVLPVQWENASESRFRVKLTDEGQSLRWLGDLDEQLGSDVLGLLPSLATVSRMDKPRPMATVLATAVSSSGQTWPVVSYQNYGTGRVVAIEGAGMWRWAFLPPQHEEYSQVYAGLWQSLIRWLVSGATLRPGQKMDLRSEKVIYESNESTWATLLLNEELRSNPPAVELRVVSDGRMGDETPIGRFNATAAGQEPGVFRVSFGTLPIGQYEARVEGGDAAQASVRFDVRPSVREQLELAARPDLMTRIAQDSGGAVLESASGRKIAALYETYMKNAQPQRIRRIPAWDRWYVLMAVLAVWAGAWGLRRASGLI